jgi:hypothetical protein
MDPHQGIAHCRAVQTWCRSATKHWIPPGPGLLWLLEMRQTLKQVFEFAQGNAAGAARADQRFVAGSHHAQRRGTDGWKHWRCSWPCTPLDEPRPHAAVDATWPLDGMAACRRGLLPPAAPACFTTPAQGCGKLFESPSLDRPNGWGGLFVRHLARGRPSGATAP